MIRIPLGEESPIILEDGFYEVEEKGLWSSDKGTLTLNLSRKRPALQN